jgi:hypothetical protein
MGIAVVFAQLVPYVLLMDNLLKQILHISLVGVAVVAYVIIWVKTSKK